MRFLLLIFILISCNSCTFIQRDWYDIYRIENNTNLDVEINAFETQSSPFHSDYIEIKSGQVYEVSSSFGEGGSDRKVFDLYNPDSVVIRFEDDKYIIQKCRIIDSVNSCYTQRNLLNYHDYYAQTTLDGKDDGRYLYVYSITKDDYNDSMPLDSIL